MSEEPIQDRSSRRPRPFAVGILLILLAPAVRAAGGVPVDETEFLAGVGDDHPAVVALTDEVARAEAALRRAGTLQNPTLEFEHEAPSDQPDQSTIKLGWKPPLDGRRGLAVDAGEAVVEAARRRFEWARLQLRQELREAFAEWAVAQRERDLVGRHFENLQELAARLQARAEHGEESRMAARRFALAVARARSQLARTEADLALSRARALALREGLPRGATAVLPDPPAVPAALGDSLRPDLRARRNDLEAARLRRRLAGRPLEFPTLIAGWTRISAAGEDFDGPWLGLSWDIPLFDRNQGEGHERTRAIAVAEARLHLTERQAVERRTAAQEAYTVLHDHLTEVSAAVQDAPALVEAASASFLAGESSMTDLLETLRSVLESQLTALDLQARTLAAHRDLELSAGRALTGGDAQ